MCVTMVVHQERRALVQRLRKIAKAYDAQRRIVCVHTYGVGAHRKFRALCDHHEWFGIGFGMILMILMTTTIPWDWSLVRLL